jgi:cytochrome c553
MLQPLRTQTPLTETLQSAGSKMDLGAGAAQSVALGQRRGDRTMKAVRIKMAWQGAILAAVFAASGSANAIDGPAVSKHSIAAKIAYCQDCHGPQGQGYYGYFPIPRLAGQQTQYIENQLQAFIEHRRTNNIMFNVAHVLRPGMKAALAARFRAFNPPPLDRAPKRLAATGREIFQNGVPDANIAACAACHGPRALGHEQIPRLAGQLYPYVVRELANWGTERGQNTAKPDTSATMLPIAHSLNRRQMQAVAAYVSNLR